MSLKIAIISDALLIGGAESFALRLAQNLNLRECNVFFYVLNSDLIDKDFCKELAPDINVIGCNVLFKKTLSRLDGVFFLVGIRFSLLRFIQKKWLKKQLNISGVDLIHSNLMPVDIVVESVSRSIGALPWVCTMHGDYIPLEKHGSRASRIIDFQSFASAIDCSVSSVAVISDAQYTQIKKIMPFAASAGRICKIYNGYSPIVQVASSERIDGLFSSVKANDFVVGMVSRGIKEKGWDVAIEAFEIFNESNAWLILVGDGPEIEMLRKNNKNKRIIFFGSVSNPMSIVSKFDVCCLPSRLSAESLPTVIIEYLVMGKPIIASDIGEIPRMIDADSDNPAGILVSVDEPASMAQCMANALQRLYESPVERVRLAENARRSAEKFDMDRCVDAYLEVYRKALER